MKEYSEKPHDGMVKSTVIGIDLGSDRYGVSASSGCVRFTLRAENPAEFENLRAFFSDTCESLAGKYGLSFSVSEHDVFPATENHGDAVREIAEAAHRAGVPSLDLPEPFRWSEDFGRYLSDVPGAIFGVGSGESCPALHTGDYVFPDEIIPYVLRVYAELIKK